jgi:3-hydroxy acid dehydrogenase/malonic semialdehyde reductase
MAYQPPVPKKALVVGASSGYGAGIATALLNAGYVVIHAARSYTGEDAQHLHVDVTDVASVDHLFDQLAQLVGTLDIVVYSAGVARGLRTVAEGVPSQYQQVFDTNTVGLYHVARRAVPLLKPHRGHLLHIGSIANTLAYEGGADYCASKAAASAIMRTLRAELLGTGIRTTSIEPGLGATNFQLARYDGDEARAGRHYAGIVQLSPADLGNTVLWLVQQPPHINFDELIIKPIEQLTHGKTAAQLPADRRAPFVPYDPAWPHNYRSLLQPASGPTSHSHVSQ